MGNAFVASFYEDWCEHGKSVIANVRETNPSIYLRVAAGLVPRDLPPQLFDKFDDLTDEELVTRMEKEAAELRRLMNAKPSVA
jgi:hypothetical protein